LRSSIGLGASCLILAFGFALLDLERARKHQEALIAENCYHADSIWLPNQQEVTVKIADPIGFPKYHPVLRVVAQSVDKEKTEEEELLADNPMLKTKLEDETFKKMLALTIPDNWTARWADAYGQAEVEAAQQLSARLKGCSKTEVANLLGLPFCNGSSPFCSLSPSGAEYRDYRRHLNSGDGGGPFSADDLGERDTWLYFFGGRHLAIRPMFVDGICTAVNFCAYERDQTYLKWRIDRLTDFAVGMTKAQILAQEGPGLSGSSLWPMDLILSQDCDETEQKNFHKIKQASDVLEYQLGYRGTIILGFRNGICIGVCTLRSFWYTVGTGLRSWDHKDYEPVFRMP
jgi:hypothetical protein